MRNAPGYTIRWNWENDRRHEGYRGSYEADLFSCNHCGRVQFCCHAVTKAPLPADAVAERCTVCDSYICYRCKLKLNSGGICEPFMKRIEREEEEAHRKMQYARLGL
jgi:hypothetical protein